jgi:capsular exopolysaccharide synthesis family protein
VQNALGLPVLGIVPQIEGMEPAEALQDRKSPASEAYLSVQTNLQFSTDHGVPKSLAVVSTRSGEGKSTSAFAIARSLARTGAKVILVDGDMRSPTVGSLLGLAGENGVSNFLAGDDNLDAMIMRAEGAGMHALLAGPTPPNAAELLTGTRLEVLLSRLSKSFDHVIVDSPPVLGLADAPLIGRRVEGVVYAVEAQGARASAIRTAIGRLNSANVNLLGVVMTKFQPQKSNYGYGYEYGYGYGKNDDAQTA